MEEIIFSIRKSKFDANIKRKSAESCLQWHESDITGVVRVEFQKFVSVHSLDRRWIFRIINPPRE
jgi:hypothetical protein